MTLHPANSTSWQPPPNFQQVPSSLDGITVFAPLPSKPQEEKPASYKCPQCGADTRFDVAAGGVACEHCGYVAPIKTQTVGVQAERFEFTLESLNQTAKGWGTDRRVLHCDGCGAEIAVEEGDLTAICPFCSSSHVDIRASAMDLLRPRFLIPFKIQVNAIREQARLWLGKGWYHPKELSSSAAVDRFRGIYLPFWTFDAAILSNWKAEVGYERVERYYDSSDRTWRSRTVIDWRWKNGRISENIHDVLISGSSHISHLILERLNPFNLNDLVIYSSDFLAGWQAHSYDVNLTDAWEEGKALMRETAKQACYHSINSVHVRNFSMTADFNDEAWRYILLPVYLASYQFEGKVFQMMANGQTGVIAGQKPVEWSKVWMAIAALMAPGFILGLAGLLFLAVGVGILLIAAGFVLLIAGGAISIGLYKQAVDSEAA
ncbi:MAG: hypothetical protein P4L50_26380 [Anaerolineaceae bacterium]|nr:hypothetical protein [Anaerolineaceae bacterium]